jgi:predicted nucleic acid-binding Zn ribbon protein
MAKYCENCGKELGETAKFCSGCGAKVEIVPAKQEVHTEVEFVHCPNCGKQVSKGFEFCTECGATIKVEQEVVPEKKKNSGKKKVVGVFCLLAVIVVAVVFGGLFLVKKLSSQNYGKALKAYREFYDEYYSEHSGELEKTASLSRLSRTDCSGKIVMKGTKPILVIADEVDLDLKPFNFNNRISYSYKGIFDVHFYEYDGRKVKEVVTIPKLLSNYNGFSIFTVEDTIYVVTGSGANGQEVYRIDKDSYCELEQIDNKLHTEIGKSGNDAREMFGCSYYTQMVFWDSAYGFFMTGEKFDNWLEYLGEQKLKSSLDLDVVLAKYLVKEGISESVRSLYWKDGIYYEYRTEDDCFYVYDADEGYTVDDALENIEGYEVKEQEE